MVGFLSDDELSSLRIVNMALHGVSGAEFVPQPARLVEHEDFFLARIRESDAAAVFGFDPASSTKRTIESIATGALSFETGAQTLAREFNRFHDGTSREGAFFIFELSAGLPNIKIFSLIKYDYEEVVEQTDGNADAMLRLIVQAFVAGKRSIQKAALVRVVEGKAESGLCATDRIKPGPDIGDYFAKYLEVNRTRSDEDLSRAVVKVLREVLTEHADDLPEKDVAAAFRRAQAHLHDRIMVTEDSVRDAVLAAAGNPEDEKTIGRIDRTIGRRVKSAKLEGLAFAPDRKIIKKPAMLRLRTTEGVVVVYPDDATAMVNREKTEVGGETITIRTKKVTDERIVSENARIKTR